MDMENVKCSLESILATFGLVLEDMEEEPSKPGWTVRTTDRRPCLAWPPPPWNR